MSAWRWKIPISPWKAREVVENLTIPIIKSRRLWGAYNPEREREILLLVASGEHTLKEIGERYGFSRQRVDQIWRKWMGEYSKPQTQGLKGQISEKMKKTRKRISPKIYCQSAACGREIEGPPHVSRDFKFCSPSCADKTFEGGALDERKGSASWN